MPNILIINNQSDFRVPRTFIQVSTAKILLKLKKNKILKPNQVLQGVNVVFVTASEIKTLNKNFRKKNKATDILSFASHDPDVLGELILCPQVITHHAQANLWPVKYEYLYMLIHGLLHLLGYDHETERDAVKMFKLQDDIFNFLSDGPLV